MDGRTTTTSATETLCVELRALNPTRQTVRCATTGAKKGLHRATAEELRAALSEEAALCAKRQPGGRSPYREAERHFQSLSRSSLSGALALPPCGGCGAACMLAPPAPAPAAPAGVGAAALRGFAPLGGIYALVEHPGAYVLPGALTAAAQEALARAALRLFAERPNRRNVDAFSSPDRSNVEWALAHGQGEGNLAPRRGVAAAALRGGGSGGSGGGEGDAAPAWRTDLWSEWRAQREGGNGEPPVALDALSWATLGLQYDWTARAYHLPDDPDFFSHVSPADPGRWSAPFPPLLAALCADIAACVHGAVRAAGGGVAEGLPLSPYHAQAGIVNYYRGAAKLKLPMGGHRDDMERTLAAPVISVSLGAPAVFLLEKAAGGAAAPPTPILLRSGDVLLLSGASRCALHGVPRVFSEECHGLFGGARDGGADGAAPRAAAAAAGRDGGEAAACAPGGAEEEESFRVYMASARINLNVRQVVEGALQ
jgi:alkylated DNA repair dioxygenase AlkB